MTVLDGCIQAGAAYPTGHRHPRGPGQGLRNPAAWYANYEWKRREAVEKGRHHRETLERASIRRRRAYARLAEDEYFDKIDLIDIVDINAGSHGRWFAQFRPGNQLPANSPAPSIAGRAADGARTRCSRSNEWDLPVVGKRTRLSCPAMTRFTACPPATRTPM